MTHTATLTWDKHTSIRGTTKYLSKSSVEAIKNIFLSFYPAEFVSILEVSDLGIKIPSDKARKVNRLNGSVVTKYKNDEFDFTTNKKKYDALFETYKIFSKYF